MATDRRTRRTPVAIVGLVSMLVACGEGSSSETVISHLHGRHEAVDRVLSFDTIDDLLANVTYSMPQREPGPLTEAVVTATVEEVSKGRGFYVEGNDAPSGLETEFDDDRVLWRTVHLTVDVEEVVSGELASDRATVGFAFGTSIPFEQIEEDFLSFGPILLLLTKDTPVFDYNSDVYATILDGEVFGLIDEAGRIELPVLDRHEARKLLGDTDTVEGLAAAARGPEREVVLDEVGTIIEEKP